MREVDKNPRVEANSHPRRFHHGALGHVLERFLSSRPRLQSHNFHLAELDQLWATAALEDAAIGLHLFATFTPQDKHVIAHALPYCADVHNMLKGWARFAPLSSDMEQVIEVDDANGMGVELRVDAPEDLVRYLTEHYCVMAQSLVCKTTGVQVFPSKACFAHPKPSYHSEYAQWFGQHIEFGCAATRLYYSATDLARPLLTRHAGMFDILSSEMDKRVARHTQLSGWAGKVAASVRQSLARGEAPSLEHQADALHQSPRTLRRRLEEQSLTFRQLLDLVRAELEQHLELTGASRAEIAFQLGYSDLAAYQHARKRWQTA